MYLYSRYLGLKVPRDPFKGLKYLGLQGVPR